MEKSPRNLEGRFDQLEGRFDQLEGRFDQIEGRFDQLEGRFDQLVGRLNQLEGRFDQLEGRFDQLEGRFNHLEGRFNHLEGRFDQLGRRFDQLEGRFNHLEGRFDQFETEVKSRFKGLEGRSINMAAQEPWDEIVPAEYKNLHENKLSEELAKIHPDKLVKLWLLSRLRNHPTLVSLLEFYDIGGWEIWGHENRLVYDSDSEFDDVFDGNPTLAAAVTNYPMIALRALVNRLGVNYERIRKRMSEWEGDQRRIREQRWERSASEKRRRDRMNKRLGHRTGPNKISKPTSGGESHNSGSDKISTNNADSKRRALRLPLKDLIGRADEARPQQTSASSSTRITWKPPSFSKGSQQKVHDLTQAASDISTVPYTEEEMVELRRR
ncbi:MAG: hypothetical protein Q9157_004004 [Trypethelium eluteriae]